MSVGWTPTPNDAGTASPAGGYPDPQQFGVLRYWDGTAWTSHTNAAGPGPIGAPQMTYVAPPTVPFGVARALRIMLTIQTVAYAVLVLV